MIRDELGVKFDFVLKKNAIPLPRNIGKCTGEKSLMGFRFEFVQNIYLWFCIEISWPYIFFSLSLFLVSRLFFLDSKRACLFLSSRKDCFVVAPKQ